MKDGEIDESSITHRGTEKCSHSFGRKTWRKETTRKT